MEELTFDLPIQTPMFESPFPLSITYGYVYMTICRISKRAYIGQKKGRIFKPWYYGSGKLIHRALIKYPITEFVVFPFDWARNQEELDEKEKFWIAYYKANTDREHFYNISKGGLYGFGAIWDSLTEEEQLEIRQHMSKPRKYMPPKDEETKKRIKESNLITYNKKEVRDKFIGQNNPFYGKTHSEETRKKMGKTISAAFKRPEVYEKLCNRNTAKGPLSEEQKHNMSIAAKKRWKEGRFDCTKKKVYLNGIIYPSIRQAQIASKLSLRKFMRLLDDPNIGWVYRF